MAELPKSDKSAAEHATDFTPPIYNVWKQVQAQVDRDCAPRVLPKSVLSSRTQAGLACAVQMLSSDAFDDLTRVLEDMGSAELDATA
jgi:hypothetical protein